MDRDPLFPSFLFCTRKRCKGTMGAVCLETRRKKILSLSPFTQDRARDARLPASFSVYKGSRRARGPFTKGNTEQYNHYNGEWKEPIDLSDTETFRLERIVLCMISWLPAMPFKSRDPIGPLSFHNCLAKAAPLSRAVFFNIFPQSNFTPYCSYAILGWKPRWFRPTGPTRFIGGMSQTKRREDESRNNSLSSLILQSKPVEAWRLIWVWPSL